MKEWEEVGEPILMRHVLLGPASRRVPLGRMVEVAVAVGAAEEVVLVGVI